MICEGAGSPAEINLRRTDIVNLGFARPWGRRSSSCPTSTGAGCSPRWWARWPCSTTRTRSRSEGFVVNRFRGDRALLEPGLSSLEALTGRPTLGVLPFVRDLWVDAEDTPDLSAYRDRRIAGRRAGTARRRGPPAPHEQPHRPRSARGRAGRHRALGLAPPGDRRRRSCRDSRDAGDGGGPCLAAAPGHRRRPRSPRLGRPARPRDLRRVPDAGSLDPRPHRERAGHGGRSGPSPCDHRLRRREDPGPTESHVGRRHDRGGVRDPPRRDEQVGGRHASSPTKGVGSGRSSARRGTDCSRTTRSDDRS